MESKSDVVSIQTRMDKANCRLTNLIAMRADGEISKDEYLSMRSLLIQNLHNFRKPLKIRHQTRIIQEVLI